MRLRGKSATDELPGKESAIARKIAQRQELEVGKSLCRALPRGDGSTSRDIVRLIVLAAAIPLFLQVWELGIPMFFLTKLFGG